MTRVSRPGDLTADLRRVTGVRRTRGHTVDVTTLAELERRLGEGVRHLSGWRVRHVDLRQRPGLLRGHDVEDAVRMVEFLIRDRADVVLGSRFLGSSEPVPVLKRLVLRTVATLSPASRKLNLTDAHNGLRALNRAVVEDMRISMNGMAHASEIVASLARSSWRIQEVPVTIRYTEYSRSKGQSLFNGVNILFDLSVRQR